MKIYVIAFVSSILAIVLNFLLKNYLLDILGLFMVLSVGILHGANDLSLIKKIKSKNSLRVSKYTLAYLSLVLLVLGAFYFIPVTILVAFVLISAYHFGEQHLQMNKKFNIPLLKFVYFNFGLSVLIGLFFFNSEFTSEIIRDITDFVIPAHFYQYALLIVLTLLFLSFLLTLLRTELKLLFISKKILDLIIVFLVFYFSELLFGFAIYFVFWHTLPSLNDQIKFLYGENSKATWLTYFKKSFPIWLVSILGLFILYFFFGNDNMYLSIMFAFIAAVTFPHVVVIERMFEKYNSKF